MQEALLSSDAHNTEMSTGELLRPRNAEFEAMKKRLEHGVIASPAVPYLSPVDPENEALSGAMKRATLPRIRPSFFRSGEPLFAMALRPFTFERTGEVGARLTDALSAAHGVSFRARVAQPAGIAYFGTVGVWDISVVAVTFDNEVTVYGITGRGSPATLTIKSLVVQVGQQACTGSALGIKARPLNWRAAVVAWVGKPAPQGKASITTRRAGGAGVYEKLVIESIDLDSDGVPDFSIWGGVMPPVVDVETYWKAVFGNVDGKWVQLAFNQEADCT